MTLSFVTDNEPNGHRLLFRRKKRQEETIMTGKKLQRLLAELKAKMQKIEQELQQRKAEYDLYSAKYSELVEQSLTKESYERLKDELLSLQEAIAKERDKELFLETGIRYYDIIRNGTFREKLRGKYKTLTEQDVAEGACYLPVGNGAFTNNTLMRQTIYWKRNGYAY